MGTATLLFVVMVAYLLSVRAERTTVVLEKKDFCDRPNQVMQNGTCSLKCRQYGGECVPGEFKNQCECKHDFATDSTNTCISLQACIQNHKKICSGDHLEYRCDYVCKKECYSVYNPRGDCPPNEECVMGCYCKEGYLRKLDGSCVLSEKCPNVIVK